LKKAKPLRRQTRDCLFDERGRHNGGRLLSAAFSAPWGSSPSRGVSMLARYGYRFADRCGRETAPCRPSCGMSRGSWLPKRRNRRKDIMAMNRNVG